MNGIRVLTPEDLPAVGALYQRVWGDPERAPPEALIRYLRALLFENPWRRLQLPSLVYEENSRVAGCIGVLPRPMRFTGRPLRVAVAHSFMLDPAARRGLAGVNLLRCFLSGEQDLSFTDAANPVSRRLWAGLGGAELALPGLCWIRILRPFRYMTQVLQDARPQPWPLGELLAHLCVPFDALVARLPPNRFGAADERFSDDAPSSTALCEGIEAASARFALRPDYDPAALQWLLELAAGKRVIGALRSRLVRDRQERPVGHYLYYVRPGATAQVLQFVAHEDRPHPLLAHLFRDAWQHGAVAVSGRLEPGLVEAIGEEWGQIRASDAVLAHAREPRLLDAVLRGNAFLSRLEGEWWLSPLERVAGRRHSG
jgi:hypothetical protein